MRKYKYTSVRELNGKPANGYFIISNYLFWVINNKVHDSWELSDSTLNEQIKEARLIAGLTYNKKIYVDDIDKYNLYTVLDEERLITQNEAYMATFSEEHDDTESDYFLY